MSRRVKMSRDKRNKASPWVVRWSDGIDMNTGKPKWFQKSFRYKLKAQDFAAEKRAEPVDLATDDAGATLSELRAAWFRTVAPKHPLATVDIYRRLFGRLEAFFGRDAPLADVTPQRAEHFIVSQARLDRKSEDLSPAARNQLLRTSHALFAVAIRWGYIRHNPFQAVEQEEVAQQRFHHLSPAQERALLEQAPTLRQKALYDLLLTTGVRVSEALSRVWRDIDFERGRLIIIDRPGTPSLPPFRVKARKKTGRRWRIVPLSPGTLALLTELQSEAPEGVPYVFLTRARYERVLVRWERVGHKDRLWSNRWLVNNVGRDFKAHCRAAEIVPDGKLSPHTLRKNTAQNMIDGGVPVKVAQEVLGHSKADTLLDHYQQVEEHHADLIRDLMGKRRGGAEPPARYVSGTYDAVIGSPSTKG